MAVKHLDTQRRRRQWNVKMDMNGSIFSWCLWLSGLFSMILSVAIDFSRLLDYTTRKTSIVEQSKLAALQMESLVVGKMFLSLSSANFYTII